MLACKVHKGLDDHFGAIYSGGKIPAVLAGLEEQLQPGL